MVCFTPSRTNVTVHACPGVSAASAVRTAVGEPAAAALMPVMTSPRRSPAPAAALLGSTELM